jgi:hypothetical protein
MRNTIELLVNISEMVYSSPSTQSLDYRLGLLLANATIDFVHIVNTNRHIDATSDPLALPPVLALAFGFFRMKSSNSTDVLASMRVLLPIFSEMKFTFIENNTRFSDLLALKLCFCILSEMLAIGMKTQTLKLFQDVILSLQLPESLKAHERSVYYSGIASVYEALDMISEAIHAYSIASESEPSEARWAYLLSRTCRTNVHVVDTSQSANTALNRYFDCLIKEFNTSYPSEYGVNLISRYQIHQVIRTIFEWASVQLDNHLNASFCCIMIPLVNFYRERLFEKLNRVSSKTRGSKKFVNVVQMYSQTLFENRTWLNDSQNMRWKICSVLCVGCGDTLLSLYSKEAMFNVAARVKVCLINILQDSSVLLTESQRREMIADEDLVSIPYDGSWTPEVLDSRNLRVPIDYNCHNIVSLVSTTSFEHSDDCSFEKRDQISIKSAMDILLCAPEEVHAINSVMRNVLQSRYHSELGLESFDLRPSLIEFCQKHKRSILSRLYFAMRGVSQRKFNDAFENYLEAFNCDRNQPVTSLSLAVLLMLFSGQRNVRER